MRQAVGRVRRMQAGALGRVLWKPASVAPGSGDDMPQRRVILRKATAYSTRQTVSKARRASCERPETRSTRFERSPGAFQFCFCFGGPGAHGVWRGRRESTQREIKNARPCTLVAGHECYLRALCNGL